MDNPLHIAHVYWQQFVLHQGAAPSLANLYTEALALLQTGIEEDAAVHSAMGWAGTLELWLDMLPHLFSALVTRHALPSPWEGTRPDFHCTQLKMAWVATLKGQSHATLVCLPQTGCLPTPWPIFITCWKCWHLLTTSFGKMVAPSAHTLLPAKCINSGTVLASGSRVHQILDAGSPF